VLAEVEERLLVVGAATGLRVSVAVAAARRGVGIDVNYVFVFWTMR
jgi:hypothetical protein